jgi:hypothetical protein
MGWIARVRLPAGQDISLYHNVQTGSWAHPGSYPVGTGVFHLRVKQPGCEANHSLPSSAKVKNMCNYTSTPPIQNVDWFHLAQDRLQALVNVFDESSGFHRRWGISWLANRLLACQEGVWSMELIIYLKSNLCDTLTTVWRFGSVLITSSLNTSNRMLLIKQRPL